MFTLVKQAKIVEVINNKCVYRNFFYAIKKIVSIFVEIYKFRLKIVMNYKAQLIVFINIFRYYMRMKKTQKKKKTIFNLTFVTNKNKKSTCRFFSFQD